MNEYIKKIPQLEEEIAKLRYQIGYLRIFHIKKKADGTDYKKKYLQSNSVKHEKSSYRNYYYIEVPTDDRYYSEKNNYQYWQRYVLQDKYENLQEEIKALIDEKEKAVHAKQELIKRNLFLNDYLNQYLTLKKTYMGMIDNARNEIQRIMEEANKEYATFPGILHKRGEDIKIADSWDNEGIFRYDEE